MGMFDRMYALDGGEWQTKAFANILNSYRIGERIPGGAPFSYQVEILGSSNDGESRDSYATLHNGVLVSIDNSRDGSLPLLDYDGRWVE